MVLVAGPELIEDVRKAPDNVLSRLEPLLEVSITCKPVNSCSQGLPQFIQPEYTLDLLNMNDEYHTDVIRSKLTRNIAVTFKEVREELVSALDDFLPTSDDSMWQSFGRKGYHSQGTQSGSRFQSLRPFHE